MQLLEAVDGQVVAVVGFFAVLFVGIVVAEEWAGIHWKRQQQVQVKAKQK